MIFRTMIITFLSICIFSSQSLAEKSGFAVGLHGGTGGIGGQLTYGLDDYLAIKLNYQEYSRDIDDEYEGNSYQGDLELESLGLLIDWNVFGGGFRITAGIMDNGNQGIASALPTGGTYELDGVEYPAESVGTLNAGVDFKSTAPYLGLGWGAPANSNNRLTFTADLGIMFQGAPKLQLYREGGIESEEIDQALENERISVEEDIKDAEFWPILQLGLHYQF